MLVCVSRLLSSHSIQTLILFGQQIKFYSFFRNFASRPKVPRMKLLTPLKQGQKNPCFTFIEWCSTTRLNAACDPVNVEICTKQENRSTRGLEAYDSCLLHAPCLHLSWNYPLSLAKLSPFSGQIRIVHVTPTPKCLFGAATSAFFVQMELSKMGHRVISMCLAKWFSHDFPMNYGHKLGITMVSNTLGGGSSSLGVSERGCSGLAGGNPWERLFGKWSAWEKTHVWSSLIIFSWGKIMGEKHMYIYICMISLGVNCVNVDRNLLKLTFRHVFKPGESSMYGSSLACLGRCWTSHPGHRSMFQL